MHSMRRQAALVSVILLALLGANFGLNLFAAELAKETSVDASGALVEKGSHRHLSTLQERVATPIDELGGLESLLTQDRLVISLGGSTSSYVITHVDILPKGAAHDIFRSALIHTAGGAVFLKIEHVRAPPRMLSPDEVPNLALEATRQSVLVGRRIIGAGDPDEDLEDVAELGNGNATGSDEPVMHRRSLLSHGGGSNGFGGSSQGCQYAASFCTLMPQCCPCNCPGGGTRGAKRKAYFGADYAESCVAGAGGSDRYDSKFDQHLGVYESVHSDYVSLGGGRRRLSRSRGTEKGTGSPVLSGSRGRGDEEDSDSDSYDYDSSQQSYSASNLDCDFYNSVLDMSTVPSMAFIRSDTLGHYIKEIAGTGNNVMYTGSFLATAIKELSELLKDSTFMLQQGGAVCNDIAQPPGSDGVFGEESLRTLFEGWPQYHAAYPNSVNGDYDADEYSGTYSNQQNAQSAGSISKMSKERSGPEEPKGRRSLSYLTGTIPDEIATILGAKLDIDPASLLSQRWFHFLLVVVDESTPFDEDMGLAIATLMKMTTGFLTKTDGEIALFNQIVRSMCFSTGPVYDGAMHEVEMAIQDARDRDDQDQLFTLMTTLLEGFVDAQSRWNLGSGFPVDVTSSLGDQYNHFRLLFSDGQGIIYDR